MLVSTQRTAKDDRQAHSGADPKSNCRHLADDHQHAAGDILRGSHPCQGTEDIYNATLETYMGKYSGKVIAIENDHLIIEEQYLNAEDKLVPKTLTLPLRRKDKKEG